MKTLTILFESPNVFKVLLNYCEHKCFPICEACEQSKANAIMIENHELIYDVNQHGNLLYFGTHLKPGRGI